jgi:hypothetical protein
MTATVADKEKGTMSNDTLGKAIIEKGFASAYVFDLNEGLSVPQDIELGALLSVNAYPVPEGERLA